MTLLQVNMLSENFVPLPGLDMPSSIVNSMTLWLLTVTAKVMYGQEHSSFVLLGNITLQDKVSFSHPIKFKTFLKFTLCLHVVLMYIFIFKSYAHFTPFLGHI